MEYHDLIKKRKVLMEKAYNGDKLTADERYWLITTPAFNAFYETPVFLSDIVLLKKSCLYEIKIKVINTNCSHKIFPKISVAGMKGSIITDLNVTNIDNEVVKNDTKVLVLMLDETKSEANVHFFAKDGLLKIEYYCSYYDENMKIIQNKSSGGCNYQKLGMLKTVTDKNTIEYRCKSEFSDTFDSLIFSVHWEEGPMGQSGVCPHLLR